MKNKFVLVIVSAVVLFFAGVVSLFSVFYVKKGGALMLMGAELRNTIEIPLSEADSLSASYGSKNLEVHVWQEERIVIKEYLNSSRADAKATVEFDGNRAVVTGGSIPWNLSSIFWGGLNERIEIYLPAKGIRELELITGSGNISAKEGLAIETENAAIRARSGNVRWLDTKAGQIILYANSGNIRGEGLTGDTKVHTNSGNITLKEVTGTVSAEASSGNITIDQLSGKCEAKAGSGNLRIEIVEVTGDITLQTGSGNQRLEVPGTISCAMDIQTGSGNIHTDFDDFLGYNNKGNAAQGQVGDGTGCKISVQAGSGNVTIKGN